jgi:hypothetical protein
MSFMSKDRSDQIFGGVMLIGIAILFLTNWFWPGILYVVGAAIIIKSVAEGKNWADNKGALVVLAVALIFTFDRLVDVFSGNFLPILLIALGLYMLFGNNRRGSGPSKRDVV